jgi:hypothetical protein
MKIVIEVKGGMIQSVISTQHIQIVILDYDNEELSGGYYSPDEIATDERINLYVDQMVELHNSKNI